MDEHSEELGCFVSFQLLVVEGELVVLVFWVDTHVSSLCLVGYQVVLMEVADNSVEFFLSVVLKLLDAWGGDGEGGVICICEDIGKFGGKWRIIDIHYKEGG